MITAQWTLLEIRHCNYWVPAQGERYQKLRTNEITLNQFKTNILTIAKASAYDQPAHVD